MPLSYKTTVLCAVTRAVTLYIECRAQSLLIVVSYVNMCVLLYFFVSQYFFSTMHNITFHSSTQRSSIQSVSVCCWCCCLFTVFTVREHSRARITVNRVVFDGVGCCCCFFLCDRQKRLPTESNKQVTLAICQVFGCLSRLLTFSFLFNAFFVVLLSLHSRVIETNYFTSCYQVLY